MPSKNPLSEGCPKHCRGLNQFYLCEISKAWSGLLLSDKAYNMFFSTYSKIPRNTFFLSALFATQPACFGHTTKVSNDLFKFWGKCFNPCPAEPGYILLLQTSVDPDQLASEEANWSGSALFAIKYVNSYQQSGSINLISWKFEKGVASLFIQQDKGQGDDVSCYSG